MFKEILVRVRIALGLLAFMVIRALNDILSAVEAAMIEIPRPKFEIGKLVATPGAIEALTDAGQSPMDFLSRHIRGDWGECCEEDQQANEEALRYGARLLSVYRTAKGTKIWVITEADRSSTCVLLPEEY